MFSSYISITGLILDIIGVIILFRHGFFSIKQFNIMGEIIKESNKQNLRISNEDPDIKEIMKLVKSSKKYSNVALGLIIIGFTLQIIGNLECLW